MKTARIFFKLLYKGILVLLPLIALLFYLKFCQLAYSDDEVPYYNWVRQLKGREFDTVILGDSTANAAFLPNILGENVVNLALGGTSPVENFYIFQNYLRHNKKPSVCYISYDDEHFSDIPCFYTRVLYSHILTFGQQAEIFRQARQLDDKDILVDGWKKKWVSHCIYSPTVYLPALTASSIGDRLRRNRHLYHNAQIHLGSYISRENGENWNQQAYIKEDFTVSDMCAYYYEKLLELCRQENITVRLVKLPVSPPVSYSPEYVSNLESFRESIKSRYPEASQDWIQEGFDQHHFFDDNHMNLPGATKFSILIRQKYPEDFSDAAKGETTMEGIADYMEITSSQELKEYLGKR
ncbi:MAG: hypothetical protein IJU95_03320 [Treponema sp.]|nr:hypothetical protein [Treponema sp.]